MNTNDVKFSVAQKLTIMFVLISAAFLSIIGYSLNGLVKVGQEIETIHKSDLPILVKLLKLEREEFRRHAIAEKVFIRRSSGDMNAEELKRWQNEYESLSEDITRELSSGHSGQDQTLKDLLIHKHGAQSTEALNQFLKVQSKLASHTKGLFDLKSDISTISENWKLIEDEFDELASLLTSETDIIIEESANDAAKLAEDEKSLIWVNIVGAIIVIILIAIIAKSFISNLTVPLDSLSKQASQIAGGDLTGKQIEIKTSDELAVLAGSFDRMQGNLREQITAVQQSIDTISTSIQQTSASIEEQAASTKEEAATIQEITTTMQEIQQSGNEITERANEVNSSSEENLKASESGLAAVEATSKSMGLIREQIEEVAEKIVNLSEKTQAIGDIVSTVNEIAEQSNILAINASIEAASAGEKGGRFSIVAQEMKNLADQAKDCTRQVRNILGEIQKGINTSVMLTEEAVKRSEAGKGHSEQADEVIRELLHATQNNMQAVHQIIAGTNQQQIGIDQVTNGMQDIRQAVQQTVAGTSELEQATLNLKSMSHQLQAIIQRYKV